MHHGAHVGGQRTTWGSQSSPSTVCILGTELRVPGLVESAYLPNHPTNPIPATFYEHL